MRTSYVQTAQTLFPRDLSLEQPSEETLYNLLVSQSRAGLGLPECNRREDKAAESALNGTK